MGGVVGKLSHGSINPAPNNANSPANNEDNFRTPAKNAVSIQILDPRSATVGIYRTPLIFSKSDNETPIKSNPYLVTVNQEETGDTNEVNTIVGRQLSGLSLNPLEYNDTLNTPESVITSRLLDPRSVTSGLNRTPLILSKMENETPVKGIQYGGEVAAYKVDCDSEESIPHTEVEDNVELSNDHPPVEIDDSLVSELDTPTVDVSDKVKKVINNTDMHFDNEIINAEGKILNSPSVNKLKMTFIYEDATPPVSESTPVKPKSGRTPLGLVSGNSSPLPSPLGTMKPWRGIREERIRLGLENTPPGSEPFLDTIQSAPGKFGARRPATKKMWSRANRIQDESLLFNFQPK